MNKEEAIKNLDENAKEMAIKELFFGLNPNDSFLMEKTVTNLFDSGFSHKEVVEMVSGRIMAYREQFVLGAKLNG